MNLKRNTMFALTLVVICIFTGATAQICFKYGMSNIDKINNFDNLLNFKTIFSIVTNNYIIVGVFLYGTAFILWLGALSTLDISYMHPLLSLGYVLTVIFAFLFIHENISLVRWMGVLFVAFGSFLIVKS